MPFCPTRTSAPEGKNFLFYHCILMAGMEQNLNLYLLNKWMKPEKNILRDTGDLSASTETLSSLGPTSGIHSTKPLGKFWKTLMHEGDREELAHKSG